MRGADGYRILPFPADPPPVALPSAHRVRIIGGRYRGRVIRLPHAAGLRPTPDRVRETLFNWLGQDLTDLSTLDLYAGSGALSLEALSRGAARAVAVERDPAVARAIRETAAEFGAAGLEVDVADARAWLAREGRRFDVVFADPPFAEDPWPWLLPACEAVLAPGGAVYAEAPRALAPEGALVVHRHAKAGQVHYHLLRRA